MTFLAFGAADVFDSDAVPGAGAEFVLESRVEVIKLVTMAGGVGEVHFGSAVAVYTPAHAERSELFDLIPILYGAVAGLALNFAGMDMLRVTEKDVVGKVVDAHPLDWFARICVAPFFRVVAGMTVQLFYLRIGIDAGAVFPEQPFALVFIDLGVTIHADIG